MPETVPADAFTARLVWLDSHEAYGGIVAARTLHPHAPIHAGHKGLFVERLDAGVIDGLPGLPGVGGGTGRVETPRLAPGAALLAHARNRWLHAGLGMWTTLDPNASGQITASNPVYHGRSLGDPNATYSLEDSFADGANLFQAYRSAPQDGRDPMGLLFSELLPSPTDMVTGALEAMVTDYSANLAFDVEWALDLSAPDDDHSRLDNSWIGDALVRGVYESFEIGIPGTDLSFNPLDLEAGRSKAKNRNGGAGGRARQGWMRGENAFTYEGRNAHTRYADDMGKRGWDTSGKMIPGVGKPDAINERLKVVRELKPFSPSGVAQGRRQLKRYIDALNKRDGGGWTGELDFYFP